MGWAPLFEGPEAERAARMVDAIAERLRATPPGDPARAFELMAGDLGRAVFLAYHARWRRDERSAVAADDLLARAVDGAAACVVPGFHGGLAGMAWALDHVDAVLGGDGEPDDGPADALAEILDGRAGSLDVEWLSGVAGWAIYLLERPGAPARARLLERIVEWMAGRGEEVDGGLRWRCPDWMPLAQDRARFPSGCYPLDPAHGAMGPIGVLAGCAAAGVARERALPILEASVDWLLAQRLPGGDGPLFPRCAGEREGGLGWCAGDPGVAGVLHAAGRALDRPAWREVAVEAARRCDPDAVALEGGLCHGVAGLGHILGRIARASGDSGLAGAAVGAFAHVIEAPPGEDTSLLTGAAGTGLALLAAVSDIEPAWDRSLLLSI